MIFFIEAYNLPHVTGHMYRVRQIPFFFLENALKNTTEYFLKFLFLFESTILPVNNGK